MAGRAVLGDDERAALEAEWRREFDFAQRLPAGDQRAAHYAWADIPDELVRRWATKKKPRLPGRRVTGTSLTEERRASNTALIPRGPRGNASDRVTALAQKGLLGRRQLGTVITAGNRWP